MNDKEHMTATLIITFVLSMLLFSFSFSVKSQETTEDQFQKLATIIKRHKLKMVITKQGETGFNYNNINKCSNILKLTPETLNQVIEDGFVKELEADEHAGKLMATHFPTLNHIHGYGYLGAKEIYFLRFHKKYEKAVEKCNE